MKSCLISFSWLPQLTLYTAVLMQETRDDTHSITVAHAARCKLPQNHKQIYMKLLPLFQRSQADSSLSSLCPRLPSLSYTPARVCANVTQMYCSKDPCNVTICLRRCYAHSAGRSPFEIISTTFRAGRSCISDGGVGRLPHIQPMLSITSPRGATVTGDNQHSNSI